MRLSDVREALKDVVTPDNNEWQVYKDLVDAIDVPCLMLVWDEPWFEGVNIGTGLALPVVTAVSGRVEPGTALETLETLVMEVVARLRKDSGGWGIRNISAPRTFDIGNLSYIAARIGLRVAVTL